MKRFEDTIRILLADEHLLVRSAISCLIGTFDNMTVVAEVDSEQQLMKEAAHYHADVALIDAAVVSVKGLETLSRLRDLCPGIKAVVLSNYYSDNFIRHLFDKGAYGFLHKNADVNALETAIQKAALGERFVFSAMQPDQFVDAASVVGAALVNGNPLTSRQNEVLKLVAQGFRSKAIADQLNVSIKTIETHRADIMRRLGVRHTAGLVHEAIRLGLLVSPQESDENE